jgi:uncharacterized protein YndB with AHSA1/START domain
MITPSPAAASNSENTGVVQPTQWRSLASKTNSSAGPNRDLDGEDPNDAAIGVEWVSILLGHFAIVSAAAGPLQVHSCPVDLPKYSACAELGLLQRAQIPMSIVRLQFTAQIAGPPEVIFELIADMPNYGRWLPDSDAFGGTVNVTPYPVRLGSTCLDAGPVEKPGKVTEFDPPRHIGFQRTVQVRQPLFKTDLDARIRYTLTPQDSGTFVLAKRK